MKTPRLLLALALALVAGSVSPAIAVKSEPAAAKPTRQERRDQRRFTGVARKSSHKDLAHWKEKDRIANRLQTQGATRAQATTAVGRALRFKRIRSGIATAVVTVAVAAGVVAIGHNGVWGTLQEGAVPTRGGVATLSLEEQGSWINPAGNANRRIVVELPDGTRESLSLHWPSGANVDHSGIELSADGNRLSYVYTRVGGTPHLFTSERGPNGNFRPGVDQGPVRATGPIPTFVTGQRLSDFIVK